MPEDRITREDVQSAVGARRELGDELEPAVVDAFLDRVEHAIDARVKKRLDADKSKRRKKKSDGGQSFALGIISLGTGIPITAIAADEGGVLGIALAWAGIVGVNVAQRISRD